MHVVPVIDIRNSEVVRAVAGRRAEYAPIVTPLAKSSAPIDVVDGLLRIHDFDALYIADLDAIERRGDARAAIEAIRAAFPALRLWVDAGVRTACDVERWLRLRDVDVIVGSESFEKPEEMRRLADDERIILSLDFLGEDFLGDPELLLNTELWPSRVIVMTLARIGAGLGPDMTRLGRFVSRAKGRRVYAAGGARGADDLVALKQMGASGALVATALHDGNLTRDDIARLAEPQKEREPRGLPF